MSDSLMPFHPAIEEPSNILPSLKNPSSTSRVGTVTCCSLPIVSVKRRSTNFASFSLINCRTSAGVIGILSRYVLRSSKRWGAETMQLMCHAALPADQALALDASQGMHQHEANAKNA